MLGDSSVCPVLPFLWAHGTPEPEEPPSRYPARTQGLRPRSPSGLQPAAALGPCGRRNGRARVRSGAGRRRARRSAAGGDGVVGGGRRERSVSARRGWAPPLRAALPGPDESSPEQVSERRRAPPFSPASPTRDSASLPGGEGTGARLALSAPLVPRGSPGRRAGCRLSERL